MTTWIKAVGSPDGIVVDIDVAARLRHLPWRLTAGRAIAVVENRFFDLTQLVAGPGAVRCTENPFDYRRASFKKLSIRDVEVACTGRLAFDLTDPECPAVANVALASAGRTLESTSWTYDGARRFAPFDKSRSMSNVSVDAIENEGTVVTLSHWPSAATPPKWKADLSTESVFKFLMDSQGDLPCDIVTSDHFDVDGLIAVYACLRPDWACERREFLSDVASCGDFCIARDPRAARVAFSLNYLAAHPESPVARDLVGRSSAERHAYLYDRILPVLDDIINQADRHEAFWRAEETALAATEQLFHRGRAVIEDLSELDLAVVRIDETEPWMCASQATTMRYLGFSSLPFHARTHKGTMLVAHGSRYEVRQRYEGWVELVSERRRPRRDLSPLAEALNRVDDTRGEWVYGGVEQFTPALRRRGWPHSSIDAQRFISLVTAYLQFAPPAWTP